MLPWYQRCRSSWSCVCSEKCRKTCKVLCFDNHDRRYGSAFGVGEALCWRAALLAVVVIPEEAILAQTGLTGEGCSRRAGGRGLVYGITSETLSTKCTYPNPSLHLHLFPDLCLLWHPEVSEQVLELLMCNQYSPTLSQLVYKLCSFPFLPSPLFSHHCTGLCSTGAGWAAPDPPSLCWVLYKHACRACLLPTLQMKMTCIEHVLMLKSTGDFMSFILALDHLVYLAFGDWRRTALLWGHVTSRCQHSFPWCSPETLS